MGCVMPPILCAKCVAEIMSSGRHFIEVIELNGTRCCPISQAEALSCLLQSVPFRADGAFMWTFHHGDKTPVKCFIQIGNQQFPGVAVSVVNSTYLCYAHVHYALQRSR